MVVVVVVVRGGGVCGLIPVVRCGRAMPDPLRAQVVAEAPEPTLRSNHVEATVAAPG